MNQLQTRPDEWMNVRTFEDTTGSRSPSLEMSLGIFKRKNLKEYSDAANLADHPGDSLVGSTASVNGSSAIA